MVSRFAALLLVLACTSCTVTVAGTPAPDAAAVKAMTGPLTAAAALGDYPTLDYCSLVGRDNYPMGQVARLPRPSFSECRLVVGIRSTTVDVMVGHLGQKESFAGIGMDLDPNRTAPRGLRVYRSVETADRCNRFLEFTDELYLEVDTVSADGKSDPCPVADATVDRIVARLTDHSVHHFDLKPNSLGRVDACGLLSTKQVETAAGATPDGQAGSLGRHECFWSLTGRGYVSVGLAMDDQLIAQPTDETIGGRRSRVVPDPFQLGLSQCKVVTSHLHSFERGGDELANLTVLLPDKQKDACAAARALAGDAWRKLP